MIARGLRARSGITLTEILIAILIMGVGLISLATLFPLGLLRLREASRNSRSGLTFRSAADDMDARALFYKPSFTQSWYFTPATKTTNATPRDPFVQDADNKMLIGGILASHNQPFLQSGLPFCYDPLWRSLTGIVPNSALYANFDSSTISTTNVDEARFGAGILSDLSVPYLQADPSGGNPSAHGLQRLTNFVPWSTNVNTLTPQYAFTYNPNGSIGDVAGNTFTSIDDVVFNATGGNASSPSSVLPDMTSGGPQVDYKYTWFVTGKQVDAGGNGTQFVGEVVVCDSRPFGFDALPGLTQKAPTGESVVEAIFGYSTTVLATVTKGTTGFAVGADRSVLLRWDGSKMADPQIRVGGWICDVTYERVLTTFKTRSSASNFPFARCYWYQIGKRNDAQVDPALGSPYRSIVLTLTSPVRAKTLLKTADGSPVNMNVGLVMPSVINVYPRAFEVH